MNNRLVYRITEHLEFALPSLEVVLTVGLPQVQVILVGHSYGGCSIARASERYPDKIHVAVHIAAPMLNSGQSYAEIHEEVHRMLNCRIIFTDSLRQDKIIEACGVCAGVRRVLEESAVQFR